MFTLNVVLVVVAIMLLLKKQKVQVVEVQSSTSEVLIEKTCDMFVKVVEDYKALVEGYAKYSSLHLQSLDEIKTSVGKMEEVVMVLMAGGVEEEGEEEEEDAGGGVAVAEEEAPAVEQKKRPATSSQAAVVMFRKLEEAKAAVGQELGEDSPLYEKLNGLLA